MILNNKAVLNVPDFSGVAGVSTFNGRTGEIEPQLGDYSAQMVGAIPKPINDGLRRVIVGDSLTEEPQGVMTFNGRHEYVVPEAGDYTAEMVGAVEVPTDDGQRRVLIGATPTLEDKVIVVDVLTSTSAIDALSANQGKALNDTKQNNITGAASTITTANLTAERILSSDSNGKVGISNVTSAELDLIKDRTTRVKSELNFNGLNITVAPGSPINLIEQLKAYTPTAGTWLPMFDISTNKMIAARNDDRTLHYKIAITGSFSNSASANSVTVDVTAGSSAVDSFTVVRLANQPTQYVNFGSLISVDKNGNFATNGAVFAMSSSTSNFVITQVRLIAEQ